MPAPRRSSTDVSIAEARRIALAAQGFGDPRPTGRIDRRHLRRVLDRIGLIQIDSVNVLVRSQELPLFARLGPHPRTLIPDATAAGELFEYWVHEASHVRTDHFHLWRWKMTQGHRWRDVAAMEQRRPTYLTDIRKRIEVDGPVVSGDLSERTTKKGQWWDWDDAKLALEYLFWKGELTATRRSNDFARIYDLTERVIPAVHLDRPAATEHEARKALLAMAAAHHGIGTFEDFTDYHRLKNAPSKAPFAELIDEGVIVPVRVEGWNRQAYRHRDAVTPRRVEACALLSPFDPVCWNRDRAERLFGFHYRIEIYTPAHKRVYGYYVLPILWGDSLVGRLDLKADRHNGALLVPGAFAEPGVGHGLATELAADLAVELTAMAEWLGLSRVDVGDRGDLAAPLRDAVDHYARTR